MPPPPRGAAAVDPVTADAAFDAATLAWIELNEGWPLPDAATIPDMRSSYEALRAHLRGPVPPGVAIVDTVLGARAARRYTGGNAGTVLFFHGGGYVVGSLDSHDDPCAGIAAQVGCTVIAVDYRLAPEYPFTAAFDDALAAARAMKGPFVLAGDSAGGNLAAGVAVALRGDARISGHVLAYPDLGGLALGLASYREKAGARLLTTADMHWYRAQYGVTAEDPHASPLLSEDLTGIAPGITFAAAEDPLRDDGAAWAQRLNDAGSRGAAHIEDGLPHSYLFARHDSAAAAAAFGRFCDAIGGFMTAPRSPALRSTAVTESCPAAENG